MKTKLMGEEVDYELVKKRKKTSFLENELFRKTSFLEKRAF